MPWDNPLLQHQSTEGLTNHLPLIMFL
jgi:hypothetical protein